MLLGGGPPALGGLRFAYLIQHFDDAYVAQAAGYPDSAAYYAAGSAATHIPGIRTPTLFLSSADDPFLGALPEAEVAANPDVALAVTARGGHCAFLQGAWPFGPAWADGAVVQWVGAALRRAGRWPRPRI